MASWRIICKADDAQSCPQWPVDTSTKNRQILSFFPNHREKNHAQHKQAYFFPMAALATALKVATQHYAGHWLHVQEVEDKFGALKYMVEGFPTAKASVSRAQLISGT
jgi:hypothetical protein